MNTPLILLVITLFIIVWGYGGYVLPLLVITIFKKKLKHAEQPLPFVSFIIPAYNEAHYLKEKIENVLANNYPSNKLEIIVQADGTTDDSEKVVQEYPNVLYLNNHQRGGKSAALNEAFKKAKGDILIFSDSNALLNSEAIIELVKAFNNPKVAVASGEKVVLTKHNNDNTGSSEGFYWKYESFLKHCDARAYSLLSAPGELLAIKKEAYKPIPSHMLLDDFYLCMSALLENGIVAYVPTAKASEYGSLNFKEEAKRKIRIAAGGWQSMVVFKKAWNFFKNPALTYLFISHRVLRWTIIPVLLLLLFPLLYASQHQHIIFELGFWAYISIWFLALIGWILNSKNKSCPFVFNIPFYVLFMNYCALAGGVRYMRGISSGTWEKVKRME